MLVGTGNFERVLKSGQMFGNYRIVDKIGVGGMGSVYLAEHPGIGKQVALKVIHPELSANKEVITRFFNEARAANQIGNEHIVDIHDFGRTDGGQHFYIMEYLEGRTLAQVLSHSPALHAHRVLHIAAQMASGLDAAHRAGIIHRDLKPDNVILVNLLGDADFVKILDFGLAKVLSAEQKLTAAGVVLGTPQYMSPEACESKSDIDHRCDIYSLGILMFQMLCGSVPFQGETMGEVLIRQVTKLPPAPRALQPSIPPSVEQIVLRCLAKDRNERFQTMSELREAALAPERYLASSPPIVRSSGQIPAQRGRSAVVAAQSATANYRVPAGQVAARLETGASTDLLGPLPPSDLRHDTAGAPLDARSQLAPGHAARTAYMDGSAVGAPPAAVAAKTAFMDPSAAVGSAPSINSAVSGPSARTAFHDQNGPLATQYLGPGVDVGQPPELTQPTPAHNRTMAIAPPTGYRQHPPRSANPIWIGVGVGMALIIFFFFGFAWPGFLTGSSVPKPTRNTEARNTAVAPSPADAAVAAPPDAAPPPKPTIKRLPAPPTTVKIELVSQPAGARVLGKDGSVLLRRTPGTIEVPFAKEELVLVFRHRRTQEQRTTVVPSGDSRVRLDLPLKKSSGRRKGSGKPKKPNKPTRDENATLKPSFD